VQRHKFPDIAFLISSFEGCGFLSSNAFAEVIIPAVQNPHWIAPFFAKLS